MKLIDLKKKIIGKRLMTIITLEPNEYIKNTLKAITGAYEDTLTSAQLLVFKNGIELIYSDFDCDGYRSGSWHLSILKEVLDKGATKEIKQINSIVRDIIYLETQEGEGKHFFMITTDGYIIMLGQENVSDYYPSNFFSVESAKEKAISDLKNVVGEVIERRKAKKSKGENMCLNGI